MGSAKSLRYEVLVYQSTNSPSAFKEQQHQPMSDDNSTSSNHLTTTALFETQLQRFKCDRENMKQYWIPEGYRPVLIHRSLANSLVATSNNNNLMNPVLSGNVIHQLKINNDNSNEKIEFRRRRRKMNISSNNHNNNYGGISKKKRNNVTSNRIVLGQSTPNNVNNIMKLKEKVSAMRNSAVSISSSSSLKNNNNNSNLSPSIIIGKMWKDEADDTKEYYERLSIRRKLTQAKAFEQKFSSPSSYGKSTRSTSCRHHVNHNNNAVEGLDAVNDVHQNISNSKTSSPNISINGRPIPDWMTRSDDEDYYDDENSSDLDATIV